MTTLNQLINELMPLKEDFGNSKIEFISPMKKNFALNNIETENPDCYILFEFELADKSTAKLTINKLIEKLQLIEPEYGNTFIDFLTPSNRSIELTDVYAEHPDSNVQLIFNICDVQATWKKEHEILNG